MYFFRVFFVSIFALFCLTQTALAATVLQLSPQILEVKEGEKFTLTVEAIPNGDKDFTVRMIAEFSPELLSVFSWSYVGDWMPLRKAGYDALDNDNGVLTKTGGFPEGFTSQTTFGTITFVAKKSGIASVKIGTESLVLNDKNSNVAALGQAAKINISATELIPVAKVLPKPLTQVQPPTKSGVPMINTSTPLDQESKNISGNESDKKINETFISSTTSTLSSEEAVPEQKSIQVKLELNSLKVKNIDELIAVATLLNLRNTPVPVAFEESILDSRGKKIYSQKWNGSLVDEKVKIMEFKDLDLPKGNYTLYVNVIEDGKEVQYVGKAFTILGDTEFRILSFLGIGMISSLLLLIAIFVRVGMRIYARKHIKTKIGHL